MDAHVEGVALGAGEVLVADVPGDGAAREADAEHGARDVEEPQRFGPRRQPHDARGGHEAPAVDRPELHDVHAVEEPCPHRDDDRHGHQRDDGGGQDGLQVARAQAVFQEDGLRCADHQVAEAEDEHPRHEGAVRAVLDEHFPVGAERLAGNGCGAHGVCRDVRRAGLGALARSQAAPAAQAHVAEDGVAVDAHGRQHREHHVEARGAQIHGGAHHPTGECQHDGLHGGHLARDAGAAVLGVVLAPDGGADRDDAGPRGACHQHEEAGAQQAPRVGGHGRHQRHARAGGQLDARDEGHLVAAVSHAAPQEAGEVGEVGRGAHEGHREVQELRRDARHARPRLLDDHRHGAALDGAEHHRQERPRQQLARIVGALHRRDVAGMEAPQPAGEHVDQRAWMCGVLHRGGKWIDGARPRRGPANAKLEPQA